MYPLILWQRQHGKLLPTDFHYQTSSFPWKHECNSTPSNPRTSSPKPDTVSLFPLGPPILLVLIVVSFHCAQSQIEQEESLISTSRRTKTIRSSEVEKPARECSESTWRIRTNCTGVLSIIERFNDVACRSECKRHSISKWSSSINRLSKKTAPPTAWTNGRETSIYAWYFGTAKTRIQVNSIYSEPTLRGSKAYTSQQQQITLQQGHCSHVPYFKMESGKRRT